MRKLTYLIVLSLIIINLTGSSASAMITNGSFETGTDPGSYMTLTPNNINIFGWITTTRIDFIGTYWQTYDGSMSIDLSGYSAGSIQQEIDTVAGLTYLVSFDMVGNPDGGPTTKALSLEAVGIDSQIFEFDCGHTTTDMDWETMQWSFVADSGITTLKFHSLVDIGFGDVLLSSIGIGFVGWQRRRST